MLLDTVNAILAVVAVVSVNLQIIQILLKYDIKMDYILFILRIIKLRKRLI